MHHEPSTNPVKCHLGRKLGPPATYIRCHQEQPCSPLPVRTQPRGTHSVACACVTPTNASMAEGGGTSAPAEGTVTLHDAVARTFDIAHRIAIAADLSAAWQPGPWALLSMFVTPLLGHCQLHPCREFLLQVGHGSDSCCKSAAWVPSRQHSSGQSDVPRYRQALPN